MSEAHHTDPPADTSLDPELRLWYWRRHRFEELGYDRETSEVLVNLGVDFRSVKALIKVCSLDHARDIVMSAKLEERS